MVELAVKPVGTKAVALDDIPKSINTSLLTIAVDTSNLSMRFDAHGNMVGGILRFYSMLPEVAVESARISMNIDHIRGLIDLLAKSANHYPVKDVPA
jgi:hypothetical protein